MGQSDSWVADLSGGLSAFCGVLGSGALVLCVLTDHSDGVGWSFVEVLILAPGWILAFVGLLIGLRALQLVRPGDRSRRVSLFGTALCGLSLLGLSFFGIFFP